MGHSNPSPRRRVLLALGAGLLAGPLALAQERKWLVGVLGSESAAHAAGRLEALRTALRDLGYGSNLTMDFRWAEGRYPRLRRLALELAALKPDLILADTSEA